jgi:hypothetical protein
MMNAIQFLPYVCVVTAKVVSLGIVALHYPCLCASSVLVLSQSCPGPVPALSQLCPGPVPGLSRPCPSPVQHFTDRAPPVATVVLSSAVQDCLGYP